MDVTAGPLFKTDSKDYSCCILILGPENLSYCLLFVTTFFFFGRAELHVRAELKLVALRPCKENI